MSKKVLSSFLIAILVVLAAIFSVYLMLDIRPPAVLGLIAVLFVLVGLPATIVFLIYSGYKVQVRLKEKEQERSETIIKEHFGEEVLGCIRVRRRVGSILGYSIIYEVLVITPDEVLVEEIRTETPQFGGGGTINRSHRKFTIPKSEIIEIGLSKLLQVTLKIITEEKEYKWWVKGLVPEKKDAKLDDYENILRPVFGDKLSVKK